MGVIWWGTGGHVPPLLAVWGGGDRISDVPPLCGIEKKPQHISIFICILRSFLLDLSGPHALNLYLYSDILSIQRMRGNRNQSHNDLHFSIKKIRPHPLPSRVSCLRRSQLVALNNFISLLSPPPPPPHLSLANDVHGFK